MVAQVINQQFIDELSSLDIDSALDHIDASRVPLTFPIYESLLHRCHSLHLGRRLHGHIVANGFGKERFLLNSLVDMYCKCHSLRDARLVFEQVSCERITFPWNIMIVAYARNGQAEEALFLYRRLLREGVKPKSITFVSVLGVCSQLGDLPEGERVHSHVLQSRVVIDQVMATALVDMYGKCGSVKLAEEVFERTCGRDLAAWTAMLAAYAENGQISHALKTLRRMLLDGLKPKESSLVGVLNGCSVVGALDEGKSLHSLILSTGLEARATVGTTLVSFYGKCGSLASAVEAFERIASKDIISWNAMLGVYAQTGHSREAIRLHHRMDLEGVKIDHVTVITLLDACASLSAVTQARALHSRILDTGIELDVVVGTALVNMYGSSGHLPEANSVFQEMEDRNVATWTAVVAAYAQTGHTRLSLETYQEMQLEGMQPNYITYVSILFACNHSGLLDTGLDYFASMSRDYGIKPSEEHCCCIVDLLGRAGRVEEAETVINSVSFRLGIASWMGLLGACRIHGDVETGARVARKAFQIESEDAAPYVILSNMYAGKGMWDEMLRVKQVMATRTGNKVGRSFMEVDGTLHEFVFGDRSQGDHVQVQEKVRELRELCGSGGCVSAEDEHSELVAVGFGFLVTEPGRTLRVVSRLEMCGECHELFKSISKTCCREIIVRDCNRLHRFDSGTCSCGD